MLKSASQIYDDLLVLINSPEAIAEANPDGTSQWAALAIAPVLTWLRANEIEKAIFALYKAIHVGWVTWEFWYIVIPAFGEGYTCSYEKTVAYPEPTWTS